MVAKEDATEEQVARERVVLLEETFAMALGTGSEMNQASFGNSWNSRLQVDWDEFNYSCPYGFHNAS